MIILRPLRYVRQNGTSLQYEKAKLAARNGNGQTVKVIAGEVFMQHRS